MISSEAPLLFSKACEIFIRELTLRAWIHTEDNKRRTQQVRSIIVKMPDTIWNMIGILKAICFSAQMYEAQWTHMHQFFCVCQSVYESKFDFFI